MSKIKRLDLVLHVLFYSFILNTMSIFFNNTIFIDPEFFGIWSIMIAIMIAILNKTIKPFLVWITIPLTGLTFGLFYPFINVLILKIVDILLWDHFYIKGIWFPFIIAILISIMNEITNILIIKPLLKKEG